jgi:hypothetical protein
MIPCSLLVDLQQELHLFQDVQHPFQVVVAVCVLQHAVSRDCFHVLMFQTEKEGKHLLGLSPDTRATQTLITGMALPEVGGRASRIDRKER